MCCCKPFYVPEPNILGRVSYLPPHIPIPGMPTSCMACSNEGEFCPLASRSDLAGQEKGESRKKRKKSLSLI